MKTMAVRLALHVDGGVAYGYSADLHKANMSGRLARVMLLCV